jgi:hypothetical protein
MNFWRAILVCVVIAVSVLGYHWHKQSRSPMYASGSPMDEVRSAMRAPGSPMKNARLVDSLYTNAFYAIALTIPSGWFVLNSDAINQATDAPPKTPEKRKNPFTDRVYELSDPELYNLLTVVEQTNGFCEAKITALGTTNVSFSILSQDVSFLEVYTGKDYLGFLYRMFRVTTYGDERLIVAGPKEVDLNGQKFYCDTFHRHLRGTPVTHRIYTRVDSHRALAFVLTAPTEGELEKSEPILRAVQFH